MVDINDVHSFFDALFYVENNFIQKEFSCTSGGCSNNELEFYKHREI